MALSEISDWNKIWGVDLLYISSIGKRIHPEKVDIKRFYQITKFSQQKFLNNIFGKCYNERIQPEKKILLIKSLIMWKDKYFTFPLIISSIDISPTGSLASLSGKQNPGERSKCLYYCYSYTNL